MDSAGKMDMSLDECAAPVAPTHLTLAADVRLARGSVIKSSRTSDKPSKKGDAQLAKAVKQRNKAQRTNKVAAARGMDIDKVPVPMARKGAKNLSSKKKIKIKGKGALKVKPAKASAKGGKASQGKLTLAAMLQKPLSNASQKSAKGGRGATPTKAGGRAAQVQVTIKNAGGRGGGGGGGRGGGRGSGGARGGGVRGKAIAKKGKQQGKQQGGSGPRKVVVSGGSRGGRGGRGGSAGGRGGRGGGTLSQRFAKR